MTNKGLKHLAILAVLGVPLVACSSTPSAPPEPSITVGFADQSAAARSGGQVIEVKTYNRQPLATAELVGISGNVIATAPGQLEPQIPAGGYPVFGPSVGVGVFGGSHGGGGGVGLGFPLGGYGETTTVPEGAFVRSRAVILVPDMATYRQTWERAVVRLKFGTTPGDTTVAEIPAPAPGGR